MNALNTVYEIEQWLNKYNIKNYVINSDFSVDTDGNVNLRNKKLLLIPVNFNTVKGNFDCSYNQLTSLHNSPHKVLGSYFCDNNQIISLEDCPTFIEGEFSCSENKLTSLQFCPEFVGEDFNCYLNDLPHLDDLTTLFLGHVRFIAPNIHTPKLTAFYHLYQTDGHLILKHQEFHKALLDYSLIDKNYDNKKKKL